MRARGAVLNDGADFLLASQRGALAVIRLHGDPAAARPACRVVASTVRSWKGS